MGKKALPWTPAGSWRMPLAMSRASLETREALRKRVQTYAQTAAAAAAAGGTGGGGVARMGPRLGHHDFSLALAWLDRGVGTIHWALQRRGVLHSTMVIFTSDHGATEKGVCYSRATHVPLIIHWPDALRPGTTIGAPTSLLDVFATIMHAAIDPSNHTLFAPPAPHPSAGGSRPTLTSSVAGRSLLALAPSTRAAQQHASTADDDALARAVVCEAGHVRSFATKQWRYVYALPSEARRGRGGGSSSSDVIGRHPAAGADGGRFEPS